MWLYGFPLPSCRANPGLAAEVFPEACVFLTDMFSLAEKYDLGELQEEIEWMFKNLCTAYAASPPANTRAGFWYLPLLRHMLTSPNRNGPLLKILLGSFRTHAFGLYSKSDHDKHALWKELQAWPDLALHLLSTGGLDGKGWQNL